MPETGSKPEADIDLVDETFDVSHSESYHLSIQTGQDRFTFCVFNTVINKYIVLRSYSIAGHDDMTGAIVPIFENDDMLRIHYKTSSHLWISPRCTFVPGHLFEAGETETYLSFNHGAIAGEQTLSNHVKPANLHPVFSCPESLISILRNYQPDIRLCHHATPFIEWITTGIASPDKKIVIYFYSCYLDIAVVHKSELLFYNTFHIHAPEDAVYYLAGVSNMLDIDLTSTKIIHAGNFGEMPQEWAILRNYAASIADFEPSHTVTYSHCIQTPIIKKFINLFNLYGCG